MTHYYKKTDRSRGSKISRTIRNILLILPVILVFSTSCTDNPSKIGIGILPDGDFVDIKTTDTIGVRAFTMYDEATNTVGSSTMVAGSIYDKTFGTTDCDFVTQLRVISAWPNKGFIIDTVYLNILSAMIKGDAATDHYVVIYETGTELKDSTEYFSNQNPDTIKLLGRYLLPDTLKVDTLNSIRIPLEKWIGEYLLRDTSVFDTATHFYQRYFKGLYFGIESEEEPMLMTLTDSKSPVDITIVYKDKVDKITRSYTFLATERAINYNRFIHDFSTAEPAMMIDHINDMVTDTLAYMQGYRGVYARIDIPSLSEYKDIERLAVNKARLIVPAYIDGVNFLEKNFPTQIYLRYRDSEGKLYMVPDQAHDLIFLDGTYSTSDDCYTFNIATFVQRYLEGDIPNPSVELYFPSGTDKNVVLRVNEAAKTVRFEFAYTLY